MIYSFSKLGNGGGSGSGSTDTTQLKAVSAIPSSGESGSVIALNKPESYAWTEFSATTQVNWSKIKGLTNESTWLAIQFENGNWTRIGNFDGIEWINSQYFLEGWTFNWDGNDFTATNGSITASGSESNGEWMIEFDKKVIEVQDDWAIPSNDQIYQADVAKISLYQANNGGTYVDLFQDKNKAEFIDPYTGAIGNTYFKAGSVISLPDNRIIYSTANQTGLDNFKVAAFWEDMGNLVSCSGGLTIWRGSQQDYDAITDKDSNTMYIII